jgi:hypothetical protein
VRIWQGKVWIDIREFYDKDGKQLPGKKGIALSKDQWTVFRDHVAEIDRQSKRGLEKLCTKWITSPNTICGLV